MGCPSFTDRRTMHTRHTARLFSSRLLIGLGLCAAQLLSTPVARADESGQAVNDTVRGDLPPASTKLTHLLESDLSSSDAQGLFQDLRELLLSRLGSDVVTERDLYLGAMQGMLDVINRQAGSRVGTAGGAVAPIGTLLGARQARRLADGLDGRMTGIGIEFRLYSNPGVLVASRIFPGSPAGTAGLLPGDQVIAINDRSFSGLPLPAVLAMLEGDEGTRIGLDVVRGSARSARRFEVSIERRTFLVPSVEEHLRHDGVGAVRIARFHRRTPAEVEECLQRLRALGAERFVIDLRNSAGGDILAAVQVADLFVPRSTVLLRLVEPGIGDQDLIAERDAIIRNDLVVLVNGWTLGAAEALAAALQDHDRAYIIGEPTRGAGRTQTLVSLGPSLVLQLESVRLQSPMGRSWHGRGIVPDLPFRSLARDLPSWTEGSQTLDPVFETAVHYLEVEAGRSR